MRFIFDNVLVENLPELEKSGSVEMFLGLGQSEHIDAPFGHVGVQLLLVVVNMEGGDSGKDLRRIAPLPTLELPSRSLHEHGHHSTPLLHRQFQGVVDHSVRNRHSALLLTLDQNLVLSTSSMRLLLFC